MVVLVGSFYRDMLEIDVVVDVANKRVGDIDHVLILRGRTDETFKRKRQSGEIAVTAIDEKKRGIV